MRCIMIVLPLLVLAASEVYAQQVRDSSFCLNVVSHKCVDSVPSGANISIGNIVPIGGKKRLYFWGNLRNPSESAVVLYFLREGECYSGEVIEPDSRAFQRLSGPEHLLAFFRSLTFKEVWHAIGIVEGEIDYGGIGGRAVFVPQANEYRIHTYREVHCSGTYYARIMDSSGRPLPGDNDLRIVVGR